MTDDQDATKAPPRLNDSTVRAMTDDHAFRVIVARSTDTVRGICQAQGASGPTAKSLADLLTATVLFRETMSPGLRVQGILKGTGDAGTLVADSAPEGATRGLLQRKKEGRDILATDGALLQMMRTLQNGSINQGVVQVPTEGGITTAMMAYMRDSEQVDTMLAVGSTLDENGNIAEAGGYMVQLLPEVGRGPLAVMAQRLEDFRSIDHLLKPEFDPNWLRDELLYGMPFTKLDQTPVAFQCWCSENRLLGALATLQRSEIQEMIDDGKPLQINCDYCRKDFSIQPASLRGLLSES